MADVKISALTALASAVAADYFAIVDDSVVQTKKITFANLEGSLAIANLSDYDANKWVDHTGVDIGTAATSGLSGGGDISSTRALVVAPELATGGTVAALDELLVADVGSADALIKVTAQSVANLASSLAASVIDSGTLAHERGGLEADVSAYAGIVGVTGGATTEVNSKAELESLIADVADFAEADGDVYTGAHDFGGADSLELPNSATPTVNADGEIAVDTTVSDFSHSVLKYYGGEELGVVAMPIAEFTTPGDGNLVAYNATNDEFELVAAAGGGNVSNVGTPTNNAIGVWTGATTIEGNVGSYTFEYETGDLTSYAAVNDSNPEIRLGATDAEEAHIQAVYDGGAQTLDYMLFQTDAASATADKGKFQFNVDGAEVANIDDDGVDLATGMGFSINATEVLNATTLGSAVVASSLTSVGTIATGTWEGSAVDHERGGLEADVSAYAGLVAVSGGATSEVNSKAELEAQIADVADFAEADGDVYTGVHDFGGADSLELPNSATPTVNADGEVAVDTTVSDFSHGVMKYYSGEELGVVAMPIAEFTTPGDGTLVAYNATNDEFELVTAAGGGNVSNSGTPTDNAIGVWTGATNIEGNAASHTFEYSAGVVTSYRAVNDGNPEVRVGATDAEELHIQSVYDGGAQTLDYALFSTDAASATADKGKFRFDVDGAEIANIDDDGVDLATGKGYSINATEVLNATTLGSAVVSSSLTSVGTIGTGTWEGTAVADGFVASAATWNAKIANVVEDTTPQLGGMLDVNGNGLGDGTLELLLFSETGSAVNEITIANAATGNGPEIQTTGDDTDIDLEILPKGDGKLVVTSGAYTTQNVLTPGATVTPDLADSNSFILTLDQNTTLANPTNVTAGQQFRIIIIQDSTPRTVTLGANYKETSTSYTASTGSGAIDVLSCVVKDADEILVVNALNFT